MTQVIHIKNAPSDWKTNPQYVYIGRAGKGNDGYYGNPYPLTPGADRGSTLERFREYAENRMASDPEYHRRILELKDKILICFCHPHPCHGHILAELSNQ